MGKKDPHIDAYIAKSAPFARPILKRLRKLIHAGCPAVEESIKWNCPHFAFHGPKPTPRAKSGWRQRCSGWLKGRVEIGNMRSAER